jgi:monoamine oxidase
VSGFLGVFRPLNFYRPCQKKQKTQAHHKYKHTMDIQKPIVIIGAGLAGLHVAEGLLDRGATDVTILERYPNVGGRVVTNRAEGLQYEIGAGRIHTSHRRVLDLVERFGLHTFPIPADMKWRPLSGASANNAPFADIWKSIHTMLVSVPKSQLAKHTIRQLLPPDWHPLLLQFPYRAELDLLRADLALESFEAEMGTYEGYVGVVEGLDSITAALAAAVTAKGAKILTRHRVKDVRRRRGGGMFEIVGDHGKKAEAKPFHIVTSQVVIATCRCTLGSFSVLKRKPVLRQVQTSPLTRIYAVYPPQASGRPGGGSHVWWDGVVGKTVTDSPLRFVIPIDPTKGLIMISYTDGVDTEFWSGLEGKDLQAAIQKEVHRLWPDVDIPEPTYLQKHEWPAGCSYWTAGDYDVAEAQREAMFGMGGGLFVVGESIARHQAWMESALVSAETLLDMKVSKPRRQTRRRLR